jgi:hypothetical protein
MLGTLAQLKSHPSLPHMVGGFGLPGMPIIPKDILPPQPGTPGVEFVALFDQVKGQSFLQAFESLKGGGQITQIEGDKATAAINRLRRDMRKEDFVKVIDEMAAIVQAGLDRARRGVLVTPDGQEYRPGEVPPVAGGAGAGRALGPGTYDWTPNGLRPAQ